MSFFITGTDTNVGKTRIAVALVGLLREAGMDATGFKPIVCGGREDAEALQAVSGGVVTINEVNPVWMRPPVAPYAAAMIEARMVDLALVRNGFKQLRGNHGAVIVEGAGGWLTPVERNSTLADLAVEFALPVLVVAGNKLGALNHTLLTVRAVLAAGLPCAGVILNSTQLPAPDDAAALTNRAVLEQLLEVPVVEVDFDRDPRPALERLPAVAELLKSARGAA